MRRLRVSNLNRSVRDEHLFEIFGHFGKVSEANVARGTVDFASAEDAEDAVRAMNGGELDGQKITCVFAETTTRRYRRDSPSPRATRKRSRSYSYSYDSYSTSSSSGSSRSRSRDSYSTSTSYSSRSSASSSSRSSESYPRRHR